MTGTCSWTSFVKLNAPVARIVFEAETHRHQHSLQLCTHDAPHGGLHFVRFYIQLQFTWEFYYVTHADDVVIFIFISNFLRSLRSLRRLFVYRFEMINNKMGACRVAVALRENWFPFFVFICRSKYFVKSFKCGIALNYVVFSPSLAVCWGRITHTRSERWICNVTTSNFGECDGEGRVNASC